MADCAEQMLPASERPRTPLASPVSSALRAAAAAADLHSALHDRPIAQDMAPAPRAQTPTAPKCPG